MKLNTSDKVFLKNIKKITNIDFRNANELRTEIKNIAKKEIESSLSINFIDNGLNSIIDFNEDYCNFEPSNILRNFDYITEDFIISKIDNIKSNVKYIKDVKYTKKDYKNAYRLFLMNEILKNIGDEESRGYILAYLAYYCEGYSNLINKRIANVQDTTLKSNKCYVNAVSIKNIILDKRDKTTILNTLKSDFEKEIRVYEGHWANRHINKHFCIKILDNIIRRLEK